MTKARTETDGLNIALAGIDAMLGILRGLDAANEDVELNRKRAEVIDKAEAFCAQAREHLAAIKSHVKQL